jgi:hypothetical protein
MASYLSAEVRTDARDRCNADLRLKRPNRPNNSLQPTRAFGAPLRVEAWESYFSGCRGFAGKSARAAELESLCGEKIGQGELYFRGG